MVVQVASQRAHLNVVGAGGPQLGQPASGAYTGLRGHRSSQSDPHLVHLRFGQDLSGCVQAVPQGLSVILCRVEQRGPYGIYDLGVGFCYPALKLK